MGPHSHRHSSGNGSPRKLDGTSTVFFICNRFLVVDPRGREAWWVGASSTGRVLRAGSLLIRESAVAWRFSSGVWPAERSSRDGVVTQVDLLNAHERRRRLYLRNNSISSDVKDPLSPSDCVSGIGQR